MNFVLQSDRLIYNDINMEVVRKSLEYGSARFLKSEMSFHELVSADKEEVEKLKKNAIMADKVLKIPVGTTDFMSAFLKRAYGFGTLNTIEIPRNLRKWDYLKREVEVAKYGDIIEREARDDERKPVEYIRSLGSYVSETCYGQGLPVKNFDHIFLKGTMCVTSEFVNVKRIFYVYVIRDNIEWITQVSGTPDMDLDMELVHRAVTEYNLQTDRPRSYTMKWMVTDRGTCLLRVNPFMLKDLHTDKPDTKLLYGLADGFRYFVSVNTPIKEFRVTKEE